MNKNHTSVVVVGVVVVDVAQAENAVYDNPSTIKKNKILISMLAGEVHTMYLTIHILLYGMSPP